MVERDPRAVQRDHAARRTGQLRPEVLHVVQRALDDVADRVASDVAASAGTRPARLVAQGDPIDESELQRIVQVWQEWRPQILAALLAVFQAGADSTGRRFAGGPLQAYANLVQRWQADPGSVPATVQRYLDSATNRLDDVGDALWQAGRRALAQGVAAGEGYDQLRRRLRQVFASDGVELGETRAERIARTEVQAAWTRAGRDVVGQLGDDVRPAYKTWLASLDRRTRDAHWQVDGTTVALLDQFKVGGVLMDGPHDPAAPAEQVVNCRCDLAYGDDPGDLPALGEGRQYKDDEAIERAIDYHEQRGITRDSGTTAAAGQPATLGGDAAGCGPGNPTPGASAMPEVPPPHVVAAARAHDHDGAMVALVPTEADQQRLALPGGEPADELHLTMAYLGPAADWTPQQRDAVTNLLRQAGLPTHPIEGHAFGAAHWNPDSDHPAWVLNVGGDDLDGVHGAVWEALRNAQGEVPLPIPDQHSPWSAHTCLAYSGDNSLLEQMEQRLGPVTFDRLRIAFAGQNTDIPLEDRMPEDDVTAAVDDDGRPVRRWSTPDQTALAFEDTETGDGRIFAPGALYWDGPGPWPLQYAEQMQGGHWGAELGGGINTMARQERRITGVGVLYTDTESGQAAIELLDRDAPLGVSVDLDDVDIEFVDARPAEEREADPIEASARPGLTGLAMSVLPMPDGTYRLYAPGLPAALTAAGVDLARLGLTAAAGDRDDGDGEVIMTHRAGDFLFRITRGRVRGATLVSMPAFADARIVLDGPAGVEPVAAADAPVGELMLEILDFVASADTPVRPGQLAEALGIPGTTARTYLSRAVASGRLARPARGLYTTVASATPAGDGTHVIAAVVGNLDLPVHGERDYEWDGSGAASRVLEWANAQAEDSDDPPSRWLAQAFLHFADGENPNAVGSYSLGFADIVDDELRIIARGVFATAGSRGVDAADIPDDEKEQIRTRICDLYRRLANEFDDDELVCPWEQDEDASASAMVASAWAEFQQLPPLPAGWFAEPTEQELPPDSGGVHVTDEGRIYGWVAQRGVPHDGLPGRDLTLDDLEPIDLSHYLRAPFRLDDGTIARCGAFTMNVGHHRDGAECETAACQFDDSRTVAGIVTCGLNDRGLWFSGAAAPWLSSWDLAVFAACQPSYHMTAQRGGGYSLRAVLSVPRPGHPSRLAASAVVDRGNRALAPSTNIQPAPTGPGGLPALVTAGGGAGDARELARTVAVAVVDEQERRAAARAEVEAMQQELAPVRANLAAAMLAQIEGGS